MKIVLAAIESELADAWARTFESFENVAIHRGSILDVGVDAVVSPSNSFGFLDGGLDRRYSEHFGWDVQARLQELIRDRHHGELVVGTAEIVETGNLRIPFLIAAPTMRVPMIIEQTVNPYLATRAALLLVRTAVFAEGSLAGELVADAVKSIALPGMGTGIGRVPFTVCARQMRAAIEEVVLGKVPFPRTWSEAQERHQKLYSDTLRDLQRPW
jgi:O-acetyl-ADP-ribose deacetylase (regulator of RNase III)